MEAKCVYLLKYKKIDKNQAFGNYIELFLLLVTISLPSFLAFMSSHFFTQTLLTTGHRVLLLFFNISH
jgi:hypothetical protein